MQALIFIKMMYKFKQVTSIAWSPFDSNILATGSHDRRVSLWDISRIGKSALDEEGPAELIFVHGGHTSKVSDISWNPNENMTLSSVAEDNILHVWKVEPFPNEQS